LTANGWTARQKADLFLNTDFSKFFAPMLVPFGVRKALALQWPISLRKLEAFYDSLTRPNPFGPALHFVPNLLINSVDAEENRQVVYCTALPAWSQARQDLESGRFYSYRTDSQGIARKTIRWDVCQVKLAKALVRSSVLPGLVADESRFMDGGIAENPLLSPLPSDSRILLLHLGYPGLVNQGGDTVPKGILNRALFAYEFKAYQAAEHLMGHFPALSVIYPGIFNEDSADFGLSRARKQAMLNLGESNTLMQWEALADAV
jgi:hypothetical protein